VIKYEFNSRDKLDQKLKKTEHDFKQIVQQVKQDKITLEQQQAKN